MISHWREAILVQLLAFILPAFALLLFRLLLFLVLQVRTVPAAADDHQQDYKDQHNKDNPHKVVSFVSVLHGLVTLTHGQHSLGLLAIRCWVDDAPLAVNLRIVHLRSLTLIVDVTLVCLLSHLREVLLKFARHLLLILSPLVLELR